MSEPPGELTPEIIRRSLDELWNGVPRPARGQMSGWDACVSGEEAAWPADEAAERASDAVEAWCAANPRPCSAVLFPLEPSRHLAAVVTREAWANGVPVHPLLVPHGEPVQGPQPARCARLPHPEGTWHWNEGTWWR